MTEEPQIDLTPQEIIRCILKYKGEIHEGIEKIECDLEGVTYPVRSNEELNTVIKMYDDKKILHNQSLALVTLLSLIQAADETKRNGGAI